VEAVKDRLYRPEIHGEAKRAAAQHTLYEVLYRVLQLLSPITPHLTEEIYQPMYAPYKGFKSLQVSPWPEFNEALVDEEAEKRGDLIMALIIDRRRDKAEKRLPLNAPIKKLTVYAGNQTNADVIAAGKCDIAGTLNVERFEILPKEDSGREIPQFSGVTSVAEYGGVFKK
jgi:valyl-tRNA synthetase